MTRYVPSIHSIIDGALQEFQLEEKLYSIEEECSKQSLMFQEHKVHGSALLEIDHTHSLFEWLEHAEMEIVAMLKSKYIQPLKEEAILWASKLASLSDILPTGYCHTHHCMIYS